MAFSLGKVTIENELLVYGYARETLKIPDGLVKLILSFNRAVIWRSESQYMDLGIPFEHITINEKPIIKLRVGYEGVYVLILVIKKINDITVLLGENPNAQSSDCSFFDSKMTLKDGEYINEMWVTTVCKCVLKMTCITNLNNHHEFYDNYILFKDHKIRFQEVILYIIPVYL